MIYSVQLSGVKLFWKLQTRKNARMIFSNKCTQRIQLQSHTLTSTIIRNEVVVNITESLSGSHTSLWSWKTGVMHCEKLADQIFFIQIYVILLAEKARMSYLDIWVRSLTEAVKRLEKSASRSR